MLRFKVFVFDMKSNNKYGTYYADIEVRNMSEVRPEFKRLSAELGCIYDNVDRRSFGNYGLTDGNSLQTVLISL